MKSNNSSKNTIATNTKMTKRNSFRSTFVKIINPTALLMCLTNIFCRLFVAEFQTHNNHQHEDFLKQFTMLIQKLMFSLYPNLPNLRGVEMLLIETQQMINTPQRDACDLVFCMSLNDSEVSLEIPEACVTIPMKLGQLVMFPGFQLHSMHTTSSDAHILIMRFVTPAISFSLFSQLLPELQLEVLSFLDAKDLARVSQCSRKIQQLASQDSLWCRFCAVYGMSKDQGPFYQQYGQIMKTIRVKRSIEDLLMWERPLCEYSEELMVCSAKFRKKPQSRWTGFQKSVTGLFK
mmetsp:Transcript_14307/g.19943  ORF Transcript_14307/g.19943 Transcript_14307/m.19943 type:complete len:291 (+) Transcript_14307:176-1048(+)